MRTHLLFIQFKNFRLIRFVVYKYNFHSMRVWEACSCLACINSKYWSNSILLAVRSFSSRLTLFSCPENVKYIPMWVVILFYKQQKCFVVTQMSDECRIYVTGEWFRVCTVRYMIIGFEAKTLNSDLLYHFFHLQNIIITSIVPFMSIFIIVLCRSTSSTQVKSFGLFAHLFFLWDISRSSNYMSITHA